MEEIQLLIRFRVTLKELIKNKMILNYCKKIRVFSTNTNSSKNIVI